MYGAEDVTAECLASLEAQATRPTILLVDNASSDGGGARLRARFPTIQYLDAGSNLGYAGGNNLGIRYALDHGAEFLFILNNDTTLATDCITRLLDGVEDAARDVVSPKILWHHAPELLWYGGGDFNRTKALGEHRGFLKPDDGAAASVAPVSFVSGCAFLMPAPVARALGGFADDFFMYCEDVELSYRAARRGMRLRYQPAARVYHKDQVRRDATPFQIRLRDRNRRRLVRRHYALLDRVRFAAWFYPTRLLRLAQYVGRADWPRAGAIVAGMTTR
jgi:GT2 family glycosyltransferase